MVIRELSQAERDKASDLFKYYKRVFVCKKCNEVFGSDLEIETCFCPKCSLENKEIKKHG